MHIFTTQMLTCVSLLIIVEKKTTQTMSFNLPEIQADIGTSMYQNSCPSQPQALIWTIFKFKYFKFIQIQKSNKNMSTVSPQYLRVVSTSAPFQFNLTKNCSCPSLSVISSALLYWHYLQTINIVIHKSPSQEHKMQGQMTFENTIFCFCQVRVHLWQIGSQHVFLIETRIKWHPLSDILCQNIS